MKKNSTKRAAPHQQHRPQPRDPRANLKPPGARKELKYYGVAACLALWKARPEDVIRIYVTEDTLKTFSEVLKWAASQRKAYHVVADDDLERLTESVHHQGVCILALEPAAVTFAEMKKQLAVRGPMLLAYLDGVENPHNLGAIVRTCAHFGIAYLLGETSKMPRMSPSACRIAEGGAEHVNTVHVPDAGSALSELHALGFIIVTTGMAGASVYTQTYPERVVLVMGAEVTGVSRAVLAMSDRTLTIPGTGHVESLNVSVAFAILAGEFARQQHRKPSRKKAG